MERNPDGTFRRGHRGVGGRPRNGFSIAAAMEKFSTTVESVDDEGNPVTVATMVARWVWNCVLTGRDGDEPIRFRDRLAAFVEIRRAIEPERRQGDAEQSDDQMDDLSRLTDDELAELERILTKAAAGEQ